MDSSKTAKERYHEKTLSVAFRLNLKESELAKRVLEKKGLKHNQLSKELFLKFLKENDD